MSSCLARSILIFLLLGLYPLLTSAMPACRPVVAIDSGHPAPASKNPLLPKIVIDSPGMHCLQEEITQRKLYDSISRAEKVVNNDRIIGFRVDGSGLDLGGHAVKNERQHGMPIVGQLRKDAPWLDDKGRILPLKDLVIRNGVLISPFRRGVGVALGEAPPKYESRYQIELLEIQSGSRAIWVGGAGNIIRNNILIVENLQALVAAGERQIIENNDITVRNRLETPDPVGFDPNYRGLPIRLAHAHGSIIRNNRIRFIREKSDVTPDAAIELVNSRDVVVEGNTVLGISAMVRADGQSTFIESGNQIRP